MKHAAAITCGIILIIAGALGVAFFGWAAWIWYAFSQIIQQQHQWSLGWGIIPELIASTAMFVAGLFLLARSVRSKRRIANG
jgi:hypothetical protein